MILDVVYNHFGPSDLDLWRFDGWSENGLGGIYFYNDAGRDPLGKHPAHYGRGEVRQFIRDNAMMWIDDPHRRAADRHRFTFSGGVHNGDDLPEGWGLAQWINSDVQEKYPGRITIAEDLRNNA